MSNYAWFCGCGEQGHGEVKAHAHASVCGLMGRPNVSELARFWGRVDRRGPDECWPWKASTEPDTGYPVFHRADRTKERGHRYALRIKLGRPVHSGLLACHTCHNRACVNPAHLYEGTDKTNSDDKIRAARHAHGEHHGATHLTDADVLEIVRRYKAGGVRQRDLAEEFGVCVSQVSQMVNGKAWQHVTNPDYPRPEAS